MVAIIQKYPCSGRITVCENKIVIYDQRIDAFEPQTIIIPSRGLVNIEMIFCNLHIIRTITSQSGLITNEMIIFDNYSIGIIR